MGSKEVDCPAANTQCRLRDRTLIAQVTTTRADETVFRQDKVSFGRTVIFLDEIPKPGTSCLLRQVSDEGPNLIRGHFTHARDVGILVCDVRGRAVQISDAVKTAFG